MAKEFVVINQKGKEVDWVDPVLNVNEYDDKFVINNGLHEYEIKKKTALSTLQEDYRKTKCQTNQH